MLTDIVEEAKLTDMAKAMSEKTGSKVAAIRADVTKVEEVQAVIDKTVELFGRVDGLFNNAGYQGSFKPIH